MTFAATRAATVAPQEKTVAFTVRIPSHVLEKAKQTARREDRSLQAVLDEVFCMEALFFNDAEHAQFECEMAQLGYRKCQQH